MNPKIVEAIAASRFAQSERVALLALSRGRALETDAFLCAKGGAPDLMVYPPRIWDRPQKALAALQKLSGARWVTHTRSGWMLVESVVAGSATAGCGTHHSQEHLDIGADDLRAALSVSSETRRLLWGVGGNVLNV